MSSYIKQILSVRAKVVLLCVVSVLVIAPNAFAAKNKAGGVDDGYKWARVYLVKQGPTVGASGDFWDGLEGTVVDKRPWDGTSADATGIFKLAADASNLYVRAEIKDCAPQIRAADMPASDAWNGTSIQVFFGTLTKRHAEYADGDKGIAFWVIPDETSDNGLKLVAAIGRVLNERQYRGAVVEWVENTSYIIEASFPLQTTMAVAKPFKAGQKVRAEFRINHAKHGEPRTVIVNWRTSTDDAWKDPNTWSDGVVEAK